MHWLIRTTSRLILSAVTLGALLLLWPEPAARAAGAADRGPAPASWSIVDLVLQTSSQEYGVNRLQDLMASEAYIASIMPGLVVPRNPGEVGLIGDLRRGRADPEAVADSFDARFVYVTMDAITPTLFALTAVSTSVDRAQDALLSIQHNLEGLRSEQLAGMESRRRATQAKLAAADQALAAATEELESLDRQAGGLDARTWMKTLQEKLAERRLSQWDAARKLAVEEGIRAHLAEQLAATPRTVKVEGPPITNPAFQQLQGELQRMRTEVELMRENELTEARMEKIRELRRRMTEVGVAVESTPKTLPGPQVEEPSPTYRQRESRLLKAEEKVAELSVSAAANDRTIDALHEEVLRTSRLAAGFEAVERRIKTAQHDQLRATDQLRELADMIARWDHPAVQLVSGPTVVASPR